MKVLSAILIWGGIACAFLHWKTGSESFTLPIISLTCTFIAAGIMSSNKSKKKPRVSAQKPQCVQSAAHEETKTPVEVQQRFTEYEAKQKEREDRSIEAWRKRVEESVEQKRKAAAEEAERQRLKAKAEDERLRAEKAAQEKQRAAELKAKEEAKQRETTRIKANISQKLTILNELLDTAQTRFEELITTINEGHTANE